MAISKRNQAIFVEVESVPGTAETLVGADAVQVQNLAPNFAANLRLIEREIIRDSLNPEQAVYGGALMSVQFEVELKGSGTIDGQPRFGDLLRACAMDETINASTSVVYNPLSDLTAHETVTIGYQEGGNFRTLAGCRGTFTLTCKAGEYARFQFTMTGHIDDESETAAPTPSLEATTPYPFVGATFTVGGFSAPIETLSLDVANEIAVGSDPNQADGFAALPRITARATKGTLNPERELIDTKDYVGIFRAGTQQAVQTGTIGTTAGNRWAIAIPKAYFRNVTAGDRDELLTYEIEFGAVDTNGIDDFSITMT